MTTDMWHDLQQLNTAHLCDMMVEDDVWDRVLSPDLRPVLPFQKMVGTAVTIRWLESAQQDEADLPRVCEYALNVDRPILVVECHGPYFPPVGSCVGGRLQIHGFEGAAVDGAVRDTNVLYEMDFQVYAHSLFPQNQGCFRFEWSNEPVTVGGVIIPPGEIIFADNDGVVVLPDDEATLRHYIERGKEILADEEALLSQIRDRLCHE